jgi:hypothetical protein
MELVVQFDDTRAVFRGERSLALAACQLQWVPERTREHATLATAPRMNEDTTHMTSFRLSRMNTIAMTLSLAFGAGCGPSTGDDAGASDAGRAEDAEISTSVPRVLSNSPASDAIGVALNTNVRAVFSEAMDPASLSAATFTVTSGDPAVAVAGTVLYAGGEATFWPAARLASDTAYTATITTGAVSASGVPLAASHTWTFTTGTEIVPGLPVELGAADGFVILAKSAVSTVPSSAVTGDIGLSPAAATFITGFSLSADSTNVFSMSPQVTGRVFAADYEVPTPSNLTTAVSDMELAFTDAAARAPDVTELGAGNIGGMTLDAGVYKWGTGLTIPTDVTLDGSATDVWIFQIAQDLTVSSGARVVLSGGARPENVFWQVAGAADLGTTAHLEGILLCQTAITLRTGASINGRLLAQTAVTIDGSTVVEPTE